MLLANKWSPTLPTLGFIALQAPARVGVVWRLGRWAYLQLGVIFGTAIGSALAGMMVATSPASSGWTGVAICHHPKGWSLKVATHGARHKGAMSWQGRLAAVTQLGGTDVLVRAVAQRTDGRRLAWSIVRTAILAAVAATTIGRQPALAWFCGSAVLKVLRDRLAKPSVEGPLAPGRLVAFLTAYTAHNVAQASLAMAFWLWGGAFGPVLAGAVLAWGLMRGALDGRGQPFGLIALTVQALRI
jgi:hypothetical protein